MTDKEMEKEIAKRSGLPRNAVRLFLDVQNDVIREALTKQEEITFKSLLKIRCSFAAKRLRDPIQGTTSAVRMLMLSVRPVKSFRKELNRWTSTQ